MVTPTTKQLCNAITEMDSSAQNAFGQIRVIAELALASLEKPETYSTLEGLAKVLIAIGEKARSAEDYINATAEDVGCNYKDPAERRRDGARRKASEATTSEVAA